jgi:hypothetical protein
MNLVHRKVPSEQTFKREAWNAMVEEEFGLAPGSAARLLAGEEASTPGAGSVSGPAPSAKLAEEPAAGSSAN